MKYKILALSIILLIGSCTKYSPQPLDSVIQKDLKFVSSGEGAHHEIPAWWEQAHSVSLNSLVEQSLLSSPDVEEVFLRLESSMIVAKQAGASKWPTTSGRIGASQNFEYADSETSDSHDFSRSFMASYELDLFGKIKNKTKAVAEDVVQASLDLTTAKLSLVTEVVLHWYAYQNELTQLGFVEEKLTLQKLVCDELEKNYKRGVSTFESYTKAKKVLLQFAEDKKGIRSAIQSEKLILGRLVGNPGYVEDVSYEKDLQFIAAAELGLPADLLRSRPDIQKAESAYRKSLLTWKVAKAERLPSLSLSISSDNRAGKIKDLFDNWLLSLAANLAGTLFDGGYRKQEVKKAEKAIEIVIQNFKKVYLDAVLEVNQLLVAIEWKNKSLLDLKEQQRLQESLVSVKKNAYQRGLLNSREFYLERITLLQQQSALLDAEHKLNELHINLFRAIGGEWFELASETNQNDSQKGELE